MPFRQYFDLTQVCRSIREEYRTIWLRNSCVNVSLNDAVEIVEVFLIDQKSNLPLPGPNLLHISDSWEKWDLGIDCLGTDWFTSLFPFLQLRAQFPSIDMKYLLASEFKNDRSELEELYDDWDKGGHKFYMEDPRSTEDDGLVPLFHHLDDDDWLPEVPQPIEDVLIHNNKHWLSGIRAGQITQVGAMDDSAPMDLGIEEPSLWIWLEDAVAQTSMHDVPMNVHDERVTLGYLQRFGFDDEEWHRQLSFHIKVGDQWLPPIRKLGLQHLPFSYGQRK